MRTNYLCSIIQIAHRSQVAKVTGDTVVMFPGEETVTVSGYNKIQYSQETTGDKAGTRVIESVSFDIRNEDIPAILNSNLRYFILRVKKYDGWRVIGDELYPCSISKTGDEYMQKITFTCTHPI